MLMAWVGLVVSIILFTRLAPTIRAGVMTHYNIGSFLAGIMAYIIIVVLVAILVKILTMLFEYMAGLLQITLANRIAGAIFCLLNVLLVIMLLIFLIESVPFLNGAKPYMKENSTILRELFDFTEKIMIDYKDKLPDILGNSEQ